jgi:hypothetical protein
MRRIAKRWLVPSAVVVAAVLVGLGAGRASAVTSSDMVFMVTTAQSEINGSLNQGWWSNQVNDVNTNSNTNYFTGHDVAYNDTLRGYFTFDTSHMRFCSSSTAYLTVSAANGGNQAKFGDGPASLELGVFDVSTDPATLSQKANNPNSTIYDDLGSGTQYGDYTLPTTTTNTDFILNLNQNAIDDMLSAHASHHQYFSFGLGLIDPPSGDAFLFADSQNHVASLTVSTPRICKVSP